MAQCSPKSFYNVAVDCLQCSLALTTATASCDLLLCLLICSGCSPHKIEGQFVLSIKRWKRGMIAVTLYIVKFMYSVAVFDLHAWALPPQERLPDLDRLTDVDRFGGHFN